jgi:xylulokinase
MFADIYGVPITESAVGENAGALGAMACAAVGAGIWRDFTPLIALNKPISKATPDRANAALYDRLYQSFRKVNAAQSDIADRVAANL